MQRPKAFSYIRISSERQTQGLGVSRQIKAAEDYAREHNLDLDTSQRDIGKSGYHGTHVKFGALGRLLDMVRDGQIPVGSYLLVESLDRLSREDVLTAQARFIELLSAGIYIVTLIDKQVYHRDKDYTQLIISLTYMSRANNESAEKSKRIRHVIKQRKLDALEGKRRFNRMAPMWIDQIRENGSDYRFEPNDHAKSIKRIFELSAAGMGVHAIARSLNTEGFPVLNPKRNKRGAWREATVSQILRNETVIGTYRVTEMIDGKQVELGEPIKNYYPAVVSEDLYWRVQSGRHRPKPTGAKGRSISNLFAGIIKCAKCGGTLFMCTAGNRPYKKQYLACTNKRLNETSECRRDKRLFPYQALEDAVLANTTSFYTAAADILSLPRKNAAGLRVRLQQEELKVQALGDERRNMMAMVGALSAPEDRAELANSINKIREQIETTKAEIERITRDLQRIDERQENMKGVVDVVEAERAKWPTMEPQPLKESRSRVALMLREFISLINVDFENQAAIVEIAGGVMGYAFDRDGNLFDVLNMSDMPWQTFEANLRVDGSEGNIEQMRKVYQLVKEA